jgi:hypothetical protein
LGSNGYFAGFVSIIQGYRKPIGDKRVCVICGSKATGKEEEKEERENGNENKNVLSKKTR